MNVRIGLFVLALTCACGVPPYMRVREGVDPRNQDTQVRFRTTYYFRVFDLCRKANGDELPLNDTLLRFRMTGKAHPLTNVIRFESGVLSKHEIDPFGATVVYDEENGQFHFQSREETESDARRVKRWDDFHKLLAEYKNLAGIGDGKPAPAPGDEAKKVPVPQGVLDALAAAAESTVKQLAPPDLRSMAETPPPEDRGDQSKAATPGTTKTTKNAQSKSSLADDCAGRSLHRGFQILGPEGWRTFDQDERLLMVMSSDPQPLIGAMRELAGRVLNEQQERAEALLPIAEAQLHTQEALRAVDQQQAGNVEEVKDLLKPVIDAFEKEEGE